MSNWSEFITKQADNSTEVIEASAASYIAVADDVVVEIAGEDAAKLLQGQITADVDKLTAGEFVLGALCTNKGRVVSTFTLFRAEKAFYCRLPRDNADQLVQTLKKYAVFYKVEISIKEDLGILVIIETSLPEGFPEPLARLNLQEDLIECWIEESQWPVALESLSTRGSLPESNWRLKKIALGWPDIHESTTETFLPHALSLDLAEAISFTKGCYTGQEIVARTHYRGKSKKRLIRMQLDGTAPSQGAELESAQGVSIGTVVVSADSAEGGSEILATANLGLPEKDELLINGSKISYTSIPLPWEN